MKVRLPRKGKFPVDIMAGHRHKWEPGRTVTRQFCTRCGINRASWLRRYRYHDPIERALIDLESMGMVERVS